MLMRPDQVIPGRSINTGVYGNILAPRASINGGSGVINGNEPRPRGQQQQCQP
ncbi:hypothetical protein ACO0LC_24200 [Undibacterium sp. JH2W]|uniref:hypothetical protein n=1 Tax=Undibacterium sp. JH2W TaxID=3413037 RepID=UPI003BEFD494